MKKGGSPALRIGIKALSAFTASVSVDKALTFYADATPVFYALGHRSKPAAFYNISDSRAYSEFYNTDGIFSSTFESNWYIVWEMEDLSDLPLAYNYNHSQTPVKYTRLDDTILSYDGSGNLATVSRESGDSLQLEYENGVLVKVINTYTNTQKEFSYSGDELTGVTVSKIENN